MFDVIIVWKLDRFARNRYDSAHYKNILKKNGVKVISATEAISSGAEGILLESMLEGYAEYHSAELAEKINRGLTENALKCKYNGGSVAFGYMIDDEQHFQINPTLAPVVLNIFNDYISGKTQKEIRDELNNKGLKNANGREFTINNISKILTNRRYVGNYIYKDVVIENGIPAIVPNDVFDKVQEMIAVNKRAPSRHKAVDDYLLTTKLYCGKCKSFMVGESGNARGRRYSYYKCVNTKRNKTCDKKAVKKDWIEDIVIYQVMKFINDDSLIEMLVNKILSIQGKESPMLKSLKKQLAQTDTAIENMLNAVEQGIITKSTKKRLDELERTKENLETEIAKENISHPLLTKEFLYLWFDGFKNFDVNKLENRKMLIDTFVNSVVLYDDTYAFLLKMLFTSITLGAGFKGGEIVPIFFTGATFGCAVAPLLGLAPGLGAALGMVALFCGCTNSPLASCCLAIEVFGGQNIELFALACAVSYMMSSYFSLYREQHFLHSKLRVVGVQRVHGKWSETDSDAEN